MHVRKIHLSLSAATRAETVGKFDILSDFGGDFSGSLALARRQTRCHERIRLQRGLSSPEPSHACGIAGRISHRISIRLAPAANLGGHDCPMEKAHHPRASKIGLGSGGETCGLAASRNDGSGFHRSIGEWARSGSSRILDFRAGRTGSTSREDHMAQMPGLRNTHVVRPKPGLSRRVLRPTFARHHNGPVFLHRLP